MPVLVDSAAGFGALTGAGERLGGQGTAEVFSFHATKPFAIGEGGLLVSGGGRLVVEDFAGIATGTRIVIGTDLMDGSGLTAATIPADLRSVHRGAFHIGRHVVVGANSVVLPDVTIGEGAIVGAGAVVTKSLEPWTINVGAPVQPVADRPSAEILGREATLRGRLTRSRSAQPCRAARAGPATTAASPSRPDRSVGSLRRRKGSSTKR